MHVRIHQCHFPNVSQMHLLPHRYQYYYYYHYSQCRNQRERWVMRAGRAGWYVLWNINIDGGAVWQRTSSTQYIKVRCQCYTERIVQLREMCPSPPRKSGFPYKLSILLYWALPQKLEPLRRRDEKYHTRTYDRNRHCIFYISFDQEPWLIWHWYIHIFIYNVRVNR